MPIKKFYELIKPLSDPDKTELFCYSCLVASDKEACAEGICKPNEVCECTVASNPSIKYNFALGTWIGEFIIFYEDENGNTINRPITKEELDNMNIPFTSDFRFLFSDLKNNLPDDDTKKDQVYNIMIEVIDDLFLRGENIKDTLQDVVPTEDSKTIFIDVLGYFKKEINELEEPQDPQTRLNLARKTIRLADMAYKTGDCHKKPADLNTQQALPKTKLEFCKEAADLYEKSGDLSKEKSPSHSAFSFRESSNLLAHLGQCEDKYLNELTSEEQDRCKKAIELSIKSAEMQNEAANSLLDPDDPRYDHLTLPNPKEKYYISKAGAFEKSGETYTNTISLIYNL